MTPTASDIDALESLLGLWNAVAYVATALVFVGVAGESAEEFADFPKTERWKSRLRKACALLLILGLAGELISLIRTSEVSGRLVAMLKDQAAQAGRDAAEANRQTNVAIKGQTALKAEAEQARLQQEQLRQQNLRMQSEVEKERTARLRIEERMTPRTLSAMQCAQVSNSLQAYRGASVTVGSPPDDPESAEFADQIIACLQTARLNVEPFIGRLMTSGVPHSFWIQFDPEKEPLVEAIASALVQAKVVAAPVTVQNDLKNGMVSIAVGKKTLTAPLSVSKKP